MARAKGGFKTRRRRNKILKAASGFRGGRSRLIRSAMETVKRGQRFAYVHRKMRKRDFRSLWVTRIGAAAEGLGISYSKLMGRLSKANILINRKMLSELAIHDPGAFKKIVEVARAI
ncbi:MAG: 50S ribosomal protein L20 [Deltaproteobacteria bacterium]|nr:50S ribosomal protein L20 [Deltaproteobacteria bacterium]MBI4373986.1 50S ribosomal protein L20 [Deltaproteobacteria bacterium]